jgi:hypothetical protein
MIYIILHPNKRPAEKQTKLLFATLDLSGIDYQIGPVENMPNDCTVITDCFVMETPHGDPGHDIAVKILDRAQKIIFYYPSESYATLSASFCPTAEIIQARNIEAYLIKCGDWDIAGYCKNYNLPEFFAWIIDNDFNRARLAKTQELIDTGAKQKTFLFLNGEHRQNRQQFYEMFADAGLLEHSIWSYRGGKSAEGFGPDQDWPDPFCHPDFRFYAYYPSHYYQSDISVVSETTQNEFFPTEKIYKTLMLGHPFVLFGGQHSLAKLRRLGFHTFESVFDESYDLCEYPGERAEAMIRLLPSLVNQNITLQTLTIRQHNRLIFTKLSQGCYLRLLNILQDIEPNLPFRENFAVNTRILQQYFLN